MGTRLRRVVFPGLAVAVVGLGLGASSAGAAKPALSPAKQVLAEVVITDKRVVFVKYLNTDVGDIHWSYVPLIGPVPRGDRVTVDILNHGTSRTSFMIFGKTSSITPGGKTTLIESPVRPGTFEYRTVTGGKTFTGELRVRQDLRRRARIEASARRSPQLVPRGLATAATSSARRPGELALNSSPGL
jgi:hypothetical protein